MGRPCSVCSHPKLKEIDQSLLIGTPYRDIARRFEISPSAAHRHSKHVQSALTAVAQEDAVAYGRTVLAQVRTLTDRAVRLLDRAEEEGDLRAATGAIREARSCVELVARLEGQIVERHAHIHQEAEVNDFKYRVDEIDEMPAPIRQGLRDGARWLILNRGEEAIEEVAETKPLISVS